MRTKNAARLNSLLGQPSDTRLARAEIEKLAAQLRSLSLLSDPAFVATTEPAGHAARAAKALEQLLDGDLQKRIRRPCTVPKR